MMLMDDGAGLMVCSGCFKCGAVVYRPATTGCPVCGAWERGVVLLQFLWQHLDDAAWTRALADINEQGFVVLPFKATVLS